LDTPLGRSFAVCILKTMLHVIYTKCGDFSMRTSL
jgi:hypothetical protein